MPEITPVLIRKHFDTLPPERRPKLWDKAMLFAMREFMRSRRDARLWLEDIVRHSPDLMPLITECVEGIILRLDAAEKRIEEREETILQLRSAIYRRGPCPKCEFYGPGPTCVTSRDGRSGLCPKCGFSWWRVIGES